MKNSIKNKIPWQLKILSKLTLSQLPINYTLWSRLSLFKHGHMENLDYAYNVAKRHYEKANFNKKGFVVLEIGPGDSLLSSLVFFALGAQKTILIDAGSYARNDISLYHEMIDLLNKKGYRLSDLTEVVDAEILLNKINCKYLTDGLSSMKKIPDSSVDLIFSQAVLEHIRLDDFDQYLKEMNRILKPDGVSSHKIDLKDHLGGGLNNLRFSHRIWESQLFKKAGFYTNRIRFSDMVLRFKNAGFRIGNISKRTWAKIPINKQQLSPKFRDLEDNELAISGFDILLFNRK